MEPTQSFQLYINEETEVQRHLLTAAGIDVLNSICWLLMDAFWMFGLPKVGIYFAIPTLFTGFILFRRERKQAIFWTHLATQCWIVMNLLWMLSDAFPLQEAILLKFAKCFLGLGMLFVFRGMHQTGNLSEALAHYKRYKLLGQKKVRVIKS